MKIILRKPFYYSSYNTICSLFWFTKAKDEYGVLVEPKWVTKIALKYKEIIDPVLEILTSIRNKLFCDKIVVHSWDTWNVDVSLARIILPVLKKFKESKTGYHLVNTDMEMVNKYFPEELRYKSNYYFNDNWNHQLELFEFDSNLVEELNSKQYDFVIDSMIYSFESIVNSDDFDNQFYVTIDGKEVYLPEKHKELQEKVAMGLMFFGMFFQGLWT